MGFFQKMFGREELPPPNVVSVDDRNFKSEVLRSKEPVLVDVWGPGCMPCKHLEPIVMRLSQEYAGRLKVVEINAARARKTVQRLRVRGTPTVIYFYKGKERERIVGFRGSPYHKDYIENELLPLVEPSTSESPAA